MTIKAILNVQVSADECQRVSMEKGMPCSAKRSSKLKIVPQLVGMQMMIALIWHSEMTRR